MLKNKKFVFLLFLALSFILFGNGIKGDFVFDDKFVIVGNPLMGQFDKIPELFISSYHYKQPLSGLYRPVTVISYSLNQAIFGPGTVSFHAVNIILHSLAAFLLFLILSVLGADRRFAAVSSLLFIFLPIHVEDVTSIIGRAELLSAVFVMSAVYYSLKNKNIIASIMFLLALLSKEMAVAFLPVWFYLFYFLKNEKPDKLLRIFTAYFLPAIVAYAGLRYLALGEHFLSNDATFAHNPIKFLPFPEAIATALKVLVIYLHKTLAPITLSSDYSFNQIELLKSIFSPIALAGLSILSGLVLLAVRYRSSLVGLGSVLFLSSYFVISNLIFKTGTIMAERLMYLPSAGLAILFGFIVEKIISKKPGAKKIVFAAVGIIFIFYGYKTIENNKNWLNERALFLSAFENSPGSVLSMTNRAYLYIIDNDLDRAEELIKKAIATEPNYNGSLYMAGRIAQLKGDNSAAQKYWERVLELRPNYLRVLRELGQLYYSTNQLQKAEKVLNNAVSQYPRWNEVFLLSLTESKLAKYDEAIKIVVSNFGENPDKNELKFALGYAYHKKGQPDKAKFYFDQSRNPEVNEEDFMRALKDI